MSAMNNLLFTSHKVRETRSFPKNTPTWQTNERISFYYAFPIFVIIKEIENSNIYQKIYM